MHTDRLLLTLTTTLLIGIASATAQVQINEVGYAGPEFEGSSTWVELHNTGPDEIDVSTFWLCNYPNYQQVGNLDLLSGSTVLPAGGFVVVEFGDLGDGDGEVGLYDSNTFSSSDAMVDYMQYGSGGHQRESVAVEAGVWAGGAFVPAATPGETLSFVGGGAVAAENWGSTDPTPGTSNPLNPEVAPRSLVDRFAEGTGTLFVRDGTNGLPGPGEPVDFDQDPFITRGLGPDGQSVRYYNFDVMPRETAPIFALFREGEETPVEGQLNIVDVIPGDEGYNDFWHVHKVTVPSDYVANTVTSREAIVAAGYPIERTNLVVNCPIVPDGSTATLRYREENPADLITGWYQGQVVYYFDFSEKMIAVELPPSGPPLVPLSPIYVSFNINPGEPGGGPPSGFMSEPESDQTHNVVATLPEDEAYSPMWLVNIYDNSEFEMVHDLTSAEAATILAPGAAQVNCPIVSTSSDVAVEPLPDEVPVRFALEGNYPNPFNPETTIRYSLDEAGAASLSVFDLLGRKVVDLVDRDQTRGVYQVTWDGRDARGRLVATGIYVYRLSMNGRLSEARTMTMLK